eukprot:CAMPEP_0203858372 /NCGR_PEP_ID=MMETSP0359-20131031/11240_1 /ASSEMBLY_ACC=CAM_ASM_000338 /TAXON_ID=268821 /ORGANISM="Scrippsiella Hangoei, Strain SHTV-5" /LENGTH=49 /DNA_ID= /DNA_START= /DNA_END= /DNA_ORIENTATION=
MAAMHVSGAARRRGEFRKISAMASQPADPRRSHLGLVDEVQLHALRAPR